MSCRAQLPEKGDATGLSEEGSGGRRVCGVGKQEKQGEADGGAALRWRCTVAEEAEEGTVEEADEGKVTMQAAGDGGGAEAGRGAMGRRQRGGGEAAGAAMVNDEGGGEFRWRGTKGSKEEVGRGGLAVEAARGSGSCRELGFDKELRRLPGTAIRGMPNR
nr:uncharacterized protein LOC109765086 [Aegilops tauschii subsp. strangulata]